MKKEELQRDWDSGIVPACQHKNERGVNCLQPSIRGEILCSDHVVNISNLVSGLNFLPPSITDEQPCANFGDNGDAIWSASGHIMWVKVHGMWLAGLAGAATHSRQKRLQQQHAGEQAFAQLKEGQ